MTDKVEITHNAAEGTLALGDTKPYREVLKRAGFRFSRNLGSWYLPLSRDRQANRCVIEAVARELDAAGVEVECSINDTSRSMAEREADRRERRSQRQERLDERATHLANAAQMHGERASEIASVIPLGQPILVGHHSEGRHRRDLRRIESLRSKEHAELQQATEAERRASSSRASEEARLKGPATIRRIERLEAEQRSIDRDLAGARRRQDSQREQELQQRRSDIEGELTYWREHLAELERDGFRRWSKDDFAKGDRVRASFGWATVLRVNAKSLTIRADVMPEVPHVLTYDNVIAKGDVPT